ncbi:MAG: hypothetical protein A3B68_09565 [Candidatus Melainabacteria bacterium RIFCSPHIGHO2_02_FULL_34_12]|nr:MAG: hypothetical protein A3B68_09565 [Candidatus Melainabacteria bacterium RIFCSPHIGHO2_02_FULL_34_12]
MPKVFISYSSKDKEFVEHLTNKLKKDNIDYWLDEKDLNIGDVLIEEISAGIMKSEYVAIIISENSNKSNWVKKELSIAINREVNEGKKVVLPIIIHDCPFPDSVADKLAANFKDKSKYENEYKRLLKAMNIVANTKELSYDSKNEPAQVPGEYVNLADTFEDIKIIGIDKSKISKNDDGTFNIYFKLSDEQNPTWVEIFDDEARFPKVSLYRYSWIEGQYAVAKCPLDEIEMQLNGLKINLQGTNAKFREALIHHDSRQRKKHAEKKEEESKKDLLFDSLDFG